MKTDNKERSLSGLAALLVFAVFAVAILSVLLSGAQAYRRITERDRICYDSRTCVQYLATKIRQASGPDAVNIAPFGDGDALLITQRYGDSDYLTRVYCHNGWLMELFTVADGGFSPEDGEKILPLRDLTLDASGGLILIALENESGTTLNLKLSVRGGEELQP